MSILIISGSVRADSYHWRLAESAWKHLDAAGYPATLLARDAHRLPLYDGDLEAQGLPPEVLRLRQVFAEHHALLFSAPEYNGSITPLLKNLLDWISLADPSAPGPSVFAGKVALITSTGPGGLGGVRGQRHLRDVLDSLGVLVLPGSVSVPRYYESLDELGWPREGRYRDQLEISLRGLALAASGQLR